jgi:hypothetical protein
MNVVSLKTVSVSLIATAALFLGLTSATEGPQQGPIYWKSEVLVGYLMRDPSFRSAHLLEKRSRANINSSQGTGAGGRTV